MRLNSLVVVLLPMLVLPMACTNVNGHAWSGGGTHYSSGTMYTGPQDTSVTDTGDTAGDTAPADTGNVTGTGMVAVSASCALEEMPNLAVAIHCSSTWSDTDAAALLGGTLIYNLESADGTSLDNATIDIAETADGSANTAILDGSTIDFYLGPIDDPTLAFIVLFYVVTADGTGSSDEIPYDVPPM